MAVGGARLGFQLAFLSEPSPFSPRILSNTRRPVPKSNRRRRLVLSSISSSSSLVREEKEELSFTDSEAALIEALLGIQGRGRAATPQQLKDVEDAVRALEALGGIADPTSNSLIEGRWQLMFTTRPGTASPIQRTFVGVDFFTIFQEVYLRTDDPRVSNIVRFSDAIGELKVEAAATISDEKRILFQFDRAAFSLKFLPFKVPYPVPFRLLGDEAKGWLDTTYLSHDGNIRISKGNKGTTFVLQKKIEPRQRLLSAISVGAGVTEVIDELVCLNHNVVVGENFQTLKGEWRLIWASKEEDESWPAAASSGLKGLQVVKENGWLENVIDLFPGCRIRVNGNLMKTSESNMYSVIINEGAVLVGGFQLPLDVRTQFNLKLLYIDNKIKITQDDKDVVFVHLRLGANQQ